MIINGTTYKWRVIILQLLVGLMNIILAVEFVRSIYFTYMKALKKHDHCGH